MTAPLRPAPTNCQQEPPYPDLATAAFSLRYPDLTCHPPRHRCRIQEPHAIKDCVEFTGPPGDGRGYASLFDSWVRHDFNPQQPRGVCPYNWCGDGTRGCERTECVALAIADAYSPESSPASTR